MSDDNWSLFQRPMIDWGPRLAWIVMAGMFGGLGFVWCLFAGPIYYLDWYRIRWDLTSLEGVTIERWHANEDISLEEVTVWLTVEGKGTLVVAGLEPGSIVDPIDHLPLVEIGSRRFQATTWGHQGVYETRTGRPVESISYGGSVDIGPDGDFGHMMPLPIRCVRDAVRHFDSIVAVVDGWPQAPATGEFTGKSGLRHTYSVVR